METGTRTWTLGPGSASGERCEWGNATTDEKDHEAIQRYQGRDGDASLGISSSGECV